MAEQPLPTPEELRQLLRYDPTTGKLFWRHRPDSMFGANKRWSVQEVARAWNNKLSGKEAFTANSRGYRVGAIRRRNFFAHRIIFAIASGRWPVNQIDHISGDRSDNRLSNLREVTNQQNQMNRKAVVSSTGLKGVTFCKRKKMYYAQIQIDGQNRGLGLFADKHDASAAYRTAAAKLFGDYASFQGPNQRD